MARIRVDDELRIRDVLTKRERVNCRHHNVVVAVHDERRLGDGRSSEYRSPRGLRHSPMAVDCAFMDSGDEGGSASLALMAALPECLAGRLACRGRREEQEEKIFKRRHGIRGNLRNARIVCQLAIPGRGSDEDKSPHQVGMTEDEALCDVAADGKPEHVHGLQAQSADKTRYVIADASIVSAGSPLELATPALC